MKSKRAPLIELRQVKQKDNSYVTTSNYKDIPVTADDKKELFERLQLVYQLRTLGHNYCKKCSDKGKCLGCIWKQIDFHLLSAENLISSLMELMNVSRPEEPSWKQEEREELKKVLIKKLISALSEMLSELSEENLDVKTKYKPS